MIETLLSSLLTAVVTSKPFLILVAYALALTVVLWALWVTLNVAYNRRKRLAYKILLVILAVPGVLADVLFQMTVATVLFWELPKEWTLSMRLTRIIAKRTADKKGVANYGWRVPLAVWIATNLVEPWARDHIGLEKFGYPAARDAMKHLMKRLP